MHVNNGWTPPTVVEMQAGMEIGAYAPAELDLPPREPPRETQGAAPRLGQSSTVERSQA